MSERVPIRFRDGDETLTLWPEKTYEDGYVVGWCPERSNNIVVHPDNVVDDEVSA